MLQVTDPAVNLNNMQTLYIHWCTAPPAYFCIIAWVFPQCNTKQLTRKEIGTHDFILGDITQGQD